MLTESAGVLDGSVLPGHMHRLIAPNERTRPILGVQDAASHSLVNAALIAVTESSVPAPGSRDL